MGFGRAEGQERSGGRAVHAPRLPQRLAPVAIARPIHPEDTTDQNRRQRAKSEKGSPTWAITDSTVSASALRDLLLPAYGLGKAECILWTGSAHEQGINDAYVVESGASRCVLKVYRHGWRSVDEVAYEVDLLHYLNRKGASVALPIPRSDGCYVSAVTAPEGDRPAVLFAFAEGRSPRWPYYEDESESRMLGRALAGFHVAAAGFQCVHSRPPLDEEILLDAGLEGARRFVRRPEDIRFLTQFVESARAALAELRNSGLPWGVCHGDYGPGNTTLTGDGGAILFDLDAGGPGWPIFDVATWKKACGLEHQASWRTFLDGYQSARPLSSVEVDALPLFESLNTLFYMGIKALFTAREQWGCWDMDFYFDDRLALLRRASDRLFSSTSLEGPGS